MKPVDPRRLCVAVVHDVINVDCGEHKLLLSHI
jgi:hypothetical protein